MSILFYLCLCALFILFSVVILLIQAKRMKPKHSYTTQIKEEIKTRHIDPIYNDLLDNDVIAKLKINMVKNVSDIPAIPALLLSIDEKKYIISSLIDRIPSLLKDAVKENKDIVYLFPSYIRYQNSIHNADSLFKEISDDLQIILNKIGISSATIIIDGGGIKMETKQLMKFCNYEKLSQTVVLLK